MVKDALANITYDELNTIMHGVSPHTKDVIRNGKLNINALTLDELCYWELLNVINIDMKYNRAEYLEDLDAQGKTELVQDLMQRVRHCYLPFSNIFVEQYTKNGEYPLGQVITLRLPADTVSNLEFAEPFIINHFAGLYGYQVKKSNNYSSDVENLNYCPRVQHDSGFFKEGVDCVQLEKREGGPINEREIINSIISKIQGKEYHAGIDMQEGARG